MTNQPHDHDDALAPMTCPACEGNGVDGGETCGTCLGEGAVEPDQPRLRPGDASDDEVRIARASFHVVTGDEAFVAVALSGEPGGAAKTAAKTAVEDAIDRGHLADEARIAAALYVLLEAAEVITAAEKGITP